MTVWWARFLMRESELVETAARFPRNIEDIPLVELCLDDNVIQEIPPFIGQITTLVDLSLANNQVCVLTFPCGPLCFFGDGAWGSVRLAYSSGAGSRAVGRGVDCGAARRVWIARTSPNAEPVRQ